MIEVPSCMSCNSVASKDQDLLASFLGLSGAMEYTSQGRELWKSGSIRKILVRSGGEFEGTFSRLRKFCSPTFAKVSHPTSITTPQGLIVGNAIKLELDDVESQRVYRCFRAMARGLHWFETQEYLPLDCEFYTTGMIEIDSEMTRRTFLRGTEDLWAGSRRWPGVFEYAGQVGDGMSLWAMGFYHRQAVVVFAQKSGAELPEEVAASGNFVRID